jgi:hypothetical protein
MSRKVPRAREFLCYARDIVDVLHVIASGMKQSPVILVETGIRKGRMAMGIQPERHYDHLHKEGTLKAWGKTAKTLLRALSPSHHASIGIPR